MFKNILIAASLLASTSAFATSTTTTFSGTDLSGSSDARTSKISISSAFDFDLSGVLDPSLRLLQDNNSGLYQGITLVSDSDSTFTYAPVILPLSQFDLTRYTFSVSNLAAGNYTLQFNLIGGGRYEGSYTINPIVVPVPEPETYGMMFAGLALMGTIAFRRQKNS
ncbi:FxDxF family PEP-CTERM protein [Methylophilus medardicus]|uniref:PEP-CTERM sorting domain-containing protein n=1 Tax=Methylophilus medardicus TaxID=2588534 RepID=A0A5B8CQW8_9PROT|nr:FxDxF family PEP-CTERM protein [Methylophilus medardicus]QDC43674.1 PEP-CTERM sorting domain-containing protein [Methylophilus medardicus]QDC48681.1 PEP-CTERM sorting domain-containing protein [Methylophilus medardicus]QDC52386.1 PEP-CTERM sorting domain-containing protein [Methylophilus medardicus]